MTDTPPRGSLPISISIETHVDRYTIDKSTSTIWTIVCHSFPSIQAQNYNLTELLSYVYEYDNRSRVVENIDTSRLRSIVWRPLYLDGTCRFLAAVCEDSTITIWDTVLDLPKISLSGHVKPIRIIK